jgi:hypothetical protein
MDLLGLIGKKLRVTRANNTYFFGVLKSINTTHAEVYDTGYGVTILVPLATTTFEEARNG